MWSYKNFEDYMMEMHMKEEPCVLDDDLPDAFSDWLCDLDPQSMIDYADKYANLKVTQAGEQLLSDLKDNLKGVKNENNK